MGRRTKQCVEVTFNSLKAALHHTWQKEAEIRNSVPPALRWRGCCGLGARIKGAVQRVGEHLFTNNSSVQWMAGRDAPAGHFPGTDLNKEGVLYFSKTQATMKHGCPFLEFGDDAEAFNFGFRPYDQFTRVLGPGQHQVVRPTGDILNSAERLNDFALANEINTTMNKFALWATDDRGRPLSFGWINSRPRGSQDKPFVPQHPRKWLPCPFLGYLMPENLSAFVGKLYDRVTEATSAVAVYDCPECGHQIDEHLFGLHIDPRSGLSNPNLLDVTVFEDGDFVATCPKCGTRDKFFRADSSPGYAYRYFTDRFKWAFIDDLREGLPLPVTACMSGSTTVRCSITGGRRCLWTVTSTALPTGSIWSLFCPRCRASSSSRVRPAKRRRSC